MSKTALVLFFLPLLIACKSGTLTSDKLVVSVTILPQKYFIERIAGDLVEVNVLIPPGANPATYEPSISQLSYLGQSPLYMRIGYVGFELSWMKKISAANPQMKIVDLSTGIEPINEEAQNKEEEPGQLPGHFPGGIDPHIWMSARNSKIIAENIYKELRDLMPEEDESLNARFNKLQIDLDSMHDSISVLLSGKKDRSFMIYHPALSYFARDFHMEQYPLELGGKEPSPAHMKWMIDLGIQKKIHTIFLQKQFDQKNAEILAREINAEIVFFNPLDSDWAGQMFHIANQLSSSL